ncbi:MAG: hypothetical protein U0744_11865 [Gemmataceae bacterium]
MNDSMAKGLPRPPLAGRSHCSPASSPSPDLRRPHERTRAIMNLLLIESVLEKLLKGK